MTSRIRDVSDLEERAEQRYREVAVHLDQRFHFETRRALAERRDMVRHPRRRWSA